MSFFLIILLLICLYKCSVSVFHNDYVSTKKTQAINGIFVLIVFMRHFSEYIKLEYNILDGAYKLFDSLMGQLIVVTFLFYSGYGMMESIKSKGDLYIEKIPKAKILKLWTNFVLAVLIYIILNQFLNIKYSLQTNILALVGWESVGNSNWYIMAMLFLYLFTFIAFKIHKKDSVKSIFVILILCFAYSIFCWLFNKGIHWYNTIVVYPIGMYFSLYRERIENYIRSDLKHYVFLLLSSIVCVVLTFIIGRHNAVVFWVLSIAFLLFLVLVTMKISVQNSLLNWLGKYVFEIYILQRIPMIILESYIGNKYIYCMLSFLFTLILAFFFKKIINVINRIYIYVMW